MRRICNSCGLEKNIREYHRARYSIGGRRRDCKMCVRWKFKNREFPEQEVTPPFVMHPDGLHDLLKAIFDRAQLDASRGSLDAIKFLQDQNVPIHRIGEKLVIESFNDYQENAVNTLASSNDVERDTLVVALGLIGEAGELTEVVKKHIGHGHDYEESKKKVLGELGDVLWYVAVLAAIYGISLQSVVDHNVEKLAKRYPAGKFSTEASVQRVDTNE